MKQNTSNAVNDEKSSKKTNGFTSETGIQMNNQDGNRELVAQIEMGEALARLEANDDFKKLISQGYIVNTLMNESKGMLDPTPQFRQEALERIMGVNYLRQYLTEVYNIAEGAKQDLAGES